jgi:MYXO-CTERM domain-containing protein
VVVSVWLVATAGCSGMSGCQIVDPLPAPLPPDQVIEGAMQVRVTPAAFTKIQQAAPAMVAGLFANGLCVPKQLLSGSWLGDVYACDTTASCPAGAQGCLVHFALQDLTLGVPDGDTLKVDMTFDIDAPLAIKYQNDLWDNSCTFNFKATAAHVVAYIRFAIDPGSGELQVHLDHLDSLDLSDSSFGSDDCSVLGTILGAVWDAAKGMMADWLVQLISPLFDTFVQGILPKPLGLEGMLDLKKTMGLLGTAAGPAGALKLEGMLETKVVPGGWAELKGGGLSMGVIGGINSDSDPTTRAPGHDPVNSQPAACVPVNPSPDLSLHGIYRHPQRQTYMLDKIPALSGAPDPPGDLVIGIAQPYLELGGFHAINSGAACVSVGTSMVELLNVGALGIIVPSLMNLVDSQTAPMLIVLRPQKPVGMTIGTGTTDDPSIQLGIPGMMADLYAYADERYVRAFTLGLDLNAGINLAIVPDQHGNPALLPTLLGIDSQHVTLTVYNTDLITETAADLEQVLPNLMVLISSALGGSLKPFALPLIGGWGMSELTLGKLTGPSCDFLTITASLAQAPTPTPSPVVAPARTRAQVAFVRNPPAAAVRAALHGDPAGEPAAVHLDLGGDGGALEWQVRIDGGMWRPFAADPRPRITDPAFALQGRHTLEVRARRRGDWRSLDPAPVTLTAIIDSLPPRLAPRRDGDRIRFGGQDLVSPPAALVYALVEGGRRGAFGASDGITLAEALRLTDGGRRPLVVAVRDEAGNVAEQAVDVAALAATGAAPKAAGCAVSPAAAGGAGALLGVAALVVLAARRRRAAALLGVGLLLAVGPGCGGGATTSGTCEQDEDCTATACAEGTIPVCGTNSKCTCADDIPLGPVGRYSSLAVTGDTVYVAAYNEKHGDLMLGTAAKGNEVVVSDWEYVDGVPADGHVVLPPPASRGGIRDAGDDVGRFSSIGLMSGLLSIAYYDRTHGSLRFAQKPATGTIPWTFHVIEGGPGAEDTGPQDPAVGRFATLSLASDGRPGVAYLAVTDDGSGALTGALRYAEATRPDPQSAADWTFYTVDEAPIPAATGPVLQDLPNAVGLMPSIARLPDDSPVVAYHDRPRGNLKLARFDPAAGVFAPPVILDGEAADGTDTGNVGQYPSLAVEADGTAHVTYVDMGRDYGHRLLYVSTGSGTPEVVDDGYRDPDPATEPGGASPVFHFVGDSSALALVGGTPVVAYQDATAFELRFAQRGADGTWTSSVIAGDEQPFAGAFGFYARLVPDGGSVVMSSYVIDQRSDPARTFVELWSRAVTID